MAGVAIVNDDTLRANGGFWKNKRVLLTGHTGFKGAWMTMLLCKLGARVSGISLSPEQPSLFDQARLIEHMQAHHSRSSRRAEDQRDCQYRTAGDCHSFRRTVAGS
jgi:nucleoside-diphosphate-sugar epimerase